MLVKNWMKRDVTTIEENEPMVKAIDIFRSKKLGKLPVTRDGKLVGILSSQDIKIVYPSEEMFSDPDELEFIKKELSAKDVMTTPVVTIKEEATIEKAAAKMLKHRVSGLPVLGSNGETVGILTLGDIFRLLVELTGLYQGTAQVAVRLVDRPGSIKEVADTIREFGGRIVSILTSYYNVPAGQRKVYIRYHETDVTRSEEIKENLRRKFNVLYFSVDILDDI